MAYVKAKTNESIESLLGRFKKAVERSGVLSEAKRREFYEKPSVKRKRKQAAARKKALKKKRYIKPKNVSFKWNKDKTKKLPFVSSYKAKKPFSPSGRKPFNSATNKNTGSTHKPFNPVNRKPRTTTTTNNKPNKGK